jgi:predicted nucleic acid-binding protein
MSAIKESRDPFFLDTNIFIYTFDERQPEKRARAMALISEALRTGNGIVSWQVVQEFLNVATRKFAVPLKTEDAKDYLRKVMLPLCRVFPDLDLYGEALSVAEKTGYSFYDALILAGALRGGCAVLYTEDLCAGQRVGRLEIVNPFG